MYVTRFNFSDTVYLYKIIFNDKYSSREHYIPRIEFEDNLEKKLLQEYKNMYPNALCTKTKIANGKFTAKFNHYYGGYRKAYGPHLWGVTFEHEDLDAPIDIGVPTSNILDIIKNNTIVNGRLENVSLALKDKELRIIMPDDTRIPIMLRDGEIRNTYTKHKTVKREPGYQYVSISCEYNYLCDITFLAGRVDWYSRYGTPDYTNRDFDFAIRCGSFPATLYKFFTPEDGQQMTVDQFISGELEVLDTALNELRNIMDDKSAETYMNYYTSCYKVSNQMTNSVFCCYDTLSSRKFDSVKEKHKSLSKYKAWLTDVDDFDMTDTMLSLREKCYDKICEYLSEATDESNRLLPPEFLNYVFRISGESLVGVTDREVMILKAVEEYCRLVNKAKTDNTVFETKQIFNTSEFYLLY